MQIGRLDFAAMSKSRSASVEVGRPADKQACERKLTIGVCGRAGSQAGQQDADHGEHRDASDPRAMYGKLDSPCAVESERARAERGADGSDSGKLRDCLPSCRA
jgi:hypothetical protein